jgi:nucleoside-diphosphate-sugar epimerase
LESSCPDSLRWHCSSTYAEISHELDSLYQANVFLPSRLAEAAKLLGIQRFVFLSSVGVHGSYTRSGENISEKSAIKPSNPYAASKALAEDRLFGIFRDSSCDLTIVRPSLVYGANAPGNLRKLQRAVDLGIPIPIAGVGNLRSLVSVHNLVSAIDVVAHHPKAANQVYLLADSELISTQHLVDTIALYRCKRNPSVRIPRALMRVGRKLPIIGHPLSQLSLDCVVNSSKIREDLSWSQPLDQSLAMAQAFSLAPNLLQG